MSEQCSHQQEQHPSLLSPGSQAVNIAVRFVCGWVFLGGGQGPLGIEYRFEWFEESLISQV